MTAFSDWQNFYVIVGSSAGALIGLQFVTVALVADSGIQTGPEMVGAFATPTIIHFSAVLLLAGALCAPWPGVAPGAVLWGLIGLGGVVYSVVVTRRMRLQTRYKPEFEDWLFHALLPLAAYATLAVSTATAFSHVRQALFAVAAAAMLLLFIGIHNAWDAVTYHIFVQRRKQQQAERQ